ncbi:MAG: hypothetical protein JWP15_1612, partial [Alphaproteobacteria bacterium]|nr:hypothetical protein [Alphaproteobacteria bacterium]
TAIVHPLLLPRLVPLTEIFYWLPPNSIDARLHQQVFANMKIPATGKQLVEEAPQALGRRAIGAMRQSGN